MLLMPPRHVVLLNATADESEMYACWLELCRYRVSVVRELPDACDLAAHETVDVVVIDAIFAFRGGDAHFQELRRLSTRCGFSILTLSGFAPRGENVILKPFLPAQLTEAIDKLLVAAPVPRQAGEAHP
jgi:DNA-binding response OmpR family regulator